MASGGFLLQGKCIPSVCTEEDVKQGWINFFIDFLQTSHDYIDTISNGTVNASIPFPYWMYPLNCHTADEESELNIRVMRRVILYDLFKVTLESEDKAMIAVIGVFGILLLVGTAADTILNIMHLDIVPDSFLKVNESLHNTLDNDQFALDISRVFCLQ